MTTKLAILVSLSLLICATAGEGAASDTPSLAERITHSQTFPQRLVWVGDTAPSDADNQALWAAQQVFKGQGRGAGVAALENFLSAGPPSPWSASCHYNLAEYYYEQGLISKALLHYQGAWALAKSYPGGTSKDLADHILAHWARLLARLGQQDTLQTLLDETKGRRLDGGALQQIVKGAREWLEIAKTNPRALTRCGAVALDRVAKAVDHDGKPLRGGFPNPQKMLEPGPPQGYTMTDLMAIVQQCNLRLIPVEWTSADPLPVPCVVHWRLNHYGAIVDRNQDSYKVVDGLFDGPVWVPASTLKAEGSGYFLVPIEKAPSIWHALPAAVTDKIVGKCFNIDSADDDDEMPTCVADCCKGQCPLDGVDIFKWVRWIAHKVIDAARALFAPGMPVWHVSEPFLNLWLVDEPLGYQPGLGPRLALNLTYKQRTYHQRPVESRIFDVSSTGLWNLNWLTYLDVTDTSGGSFVYYNARLYVAGGGARSYDWPAYPPDDYGSTTRLERLPDATSTLTGFRLTYPDSHQETFGYMVDYDTGKKWAFRTAMTDPFGQSIQFNYGITNDIVQLRSVVDADGQTTTLAYASDDPRMIEWVTDPFGRAVHLTRTSGQLTTITDVAQLTSSFAYDANGWLTSLVTTNGTTTFRLVGDSGGTLQAINSVTRAAEITEPNGGTQLFIYRQLSSHLTESDPNVFLPDSYTSLPSGTPSDTWDNTQMSYRNSFHWEQNQWAGLTAGYRTTGDFAQLTLSDYLKASRTHWLVKDAGTLGESKSMEQAPSPDGTTSGQMTWYNYLGQVSPYYTEGSKSLPQVVARVMPDGTTQYMSTSWTPEGRIQNVTASYGSGGSPPVRTYQFSYAPNWIDVASATGPGGWQTTYQYNAQHQVTQSSFQNEVTSWDYDAAGRMTNITFPSGLRRALNYPAGGSFVNFPSSIIDWEAATGHRLSTNTFTYANNLLSSHTDARGLMRNFTWDALNRLTGVGFPDGTWTSNQYRGLNLTARKDRLGNWTYYAYDELGRVTGVTNSWATNQITYCGCGSPGKIINGLGQELNFVYDNAGQLKTVIYPDSQSVNFQYDPLGRLQSRTDSAQHVTTYTYNQQGLVTSVTGAYGVLFAADYDILDRPVSVTDANGVTSTQTFDRSGRMQTRSWLGGSITETWLYDPSATGPVGYYDAAGLWTQFSYDTRGQLTNECLPMWNSSNHGLTYSPAGDLQTIQDANGHTTTWHYNAYGQVTDKVDANGNTNLIYLYDANGRLTNRWTPEKYWTHYERDDAGNITSVTHSNSPNVSLAYDALGRLTSMVDGVGTTRLTYDADGFLTSEDGPWEADTVTYQTVNGLRASLTLAQPGGGSWTQTYGYDVHNRLLNTVSPAGTFGYEYTGAQATTAPGVRVKKVNMPSGLMVDNGYDEMARWASTLMRGNNQATLLSHQYLYNAASQRTNYARFDGASSSYVNYTYLQAGQLFTASGFEADGTPRLQEQFQYNYWTWDVAGNMAYRTKNGIATANNYNNLNQLTSVQRGSTMTVAGIASSLATSVTVNGQPAQLYGDKTFALAGVNLVDGTNSFTAVAQDGYAGSSSHTVTLFLPATTTYQYDANGNLTSDGVRSFAYDDENQLISVQVANAWRAEFAYDGLGRRRILRDYDLSGGTPVLTNEVHFVYDGRLVIQERDGNNVPTATYTRGLDLSGGLQGAGGIGGLLARSQVYNSGTWSTHLYYFSDGNGNVTALLNASQGKIAQYQYDPYGYLMASSGSRAAGNLYRFSSKELHVSSGLYYYGFRYYDPNLQRWLNQDPIGEAGGINLYAFVDNAPTGWVDPFGEGLFSSDVSQAEWDELSRLEGAPLRQPTLDDFEDQALRCGRKGAFVTDSQAAQGAHLAKEIGIEAAAGMALPEVKTVRVLSTAKRLRQIKALTAGAERASKALVGIRSYEELTALTRGFEGQIQAHHLIEQRHLVNAGYSAEQIAQSPAIIVTRRQHERFNELLADALPVGRVYSKSTVLKAYERVYANHPDWLEAIKDWLAK